MIERLATHLLLRPEDIRPSHPDFEVIGVFNPGVARLGDETIILHLKSGTYFGLDATGTRIWTLLKQGLGPLEICARLSTDYSIARETIETDVREFLDNLEANDILIDL